MCGGEGVPPGWVDCTTPSDAPTGHHLTTVEAFKARVEDGKGDWVNSVLSATLLWNNCNDLDLWVVEPSGNVINWKNPTSDTGGALSLDGNNNECHTKEAVEFTSWGLDSSPVDGAYQAVVYYNHPRTKLVSTPYTLYIQGKDGVGKTYYS